MPLEKVEDSPFLRLRVAKIVAVYFDKDAPEIPAETNQSNDFTLGRAKVEWLDWEGQRDFVQLSFPSFSTASANTGPGESRVVIPYGDLSMPSVGDVVILGFRDPSNAVILGYLPANYRRATDPDDRTTDPDETTQGTLRRIIPGEFSRKSRQQAEIYQDKAGATQIISKAQPTIGVAGVPASTATNGSATSKASNIDQAALPTEEIVRVTVGETYTNEKFTSRLVSQSDKKIVYAVLCKQSGAYQVIDTDGNQEILGNAISLIQQTEDAAALITMASDGSISMVDKAGNTIFLDPDNGEIKIASEAGDNVLIGGGNVQITTKGGESMVLDNAEKTITINAQNVNVNSGTTTLGTGATDTVTLTSLLVALFNSHIHSGVTAGGSITGAPVVPWVTTPGLPTSPSAKATFAK